MMFKDCTAAFKCIIECFKDKFIRTTCIYLKMCYTNHFRAYGLNLIILTISFLKAETLYSFDSHKNSLYS